MNQPFRQRSSDQASSQSCVSRLFLFWTNHYSNISHHRKITDSDIVNSGQRDAFQEIYNRWMNIWSQIDSLTVDSPGQKLRYAMWLTFKKQLLFATIMGFIAHQINALTPIFIYLISEHSHSPNYVIAIIAIMFTFKLIKIFLSMHSEYILKNVGSHIFACLCHALTQKSLFGIHSCEKQLTASQVSALAQSHCARVLEYPFTLITTLLEFYSFVFTMVSLFVVSGWQGLVSCIVLLALQMTRYAMMDVFKKYQHQVSRCASDRIAAFIRVINNIKFIKVNSLEMKFFNKLNDLREKEVLSLQIFLNLGIFTSTMQYGTNKIGITVFILLLALSNQPLELSIIYTVMIFHRYMGLHRIMNKANELGDVDISLAKIEEYFSLKEADWSYIARNSDTIEKNNTAIAVQNGNFYWQNMQSEQTNGKANFSLKNINFMIRKGQFVIIIGKFGSGKSSILNAILGEMNNELSNISINGSIAYTSQTAWIMSDTVKNNILFGNPYDSQRYEKALYYSHLKTDLELFLNGDSTVIGERGSTISGGQRARISLARALYADSDIYILDDVLSALDALVGNFIVQETLTKYLKGKTIVFSTHSVHFLSLADRIFHVDEGRIEQINKEYNLSRFIQNNEGYSFKKMQKEIVHQDIDQENIGMPCNLPEWESQHEQATDSQLFSLYIRRRGGLTYVVSVSIFLMLMILTGSFFFVWLNHWIKASDNQSAYYYLLTILVVSTNLISTGGYFYMEYNSDFYYNYHQTMVGRILVAPMSYFQTTPSSKTVNKLSMDLKKVDNDVISQFRNTVFYMANGGAFFFNFMIIYIKMNQIFMIALVVALVVTIVFCYKYFMKTIRQLHQIEQSAQINIFSSVLETLQGSQTIRAYQREKFTKEKQQITINRFLMTEKVVTGINIYSASIISLITTIVTTMLFAKLLIIDQADSSEFFLVFNIFSFERTLYNFQDALVDFLDSLKYLKSCDEILALEPEKGYDLIHEQEGFRFKEISREGWIGRGQINFEELSVKYRPELETVLKAISLQIRSGEKIGVVGRTGSGKSTTILSLLRILEPSDGRIVVDGVDICCLDLQTLRTGFSVILQDHFLFAGTLRHNIDPLNEFDDGSIIQALKHCELWESIKQRNGLQTVIEEDGKNFSTGERQLINISRALLRPKKVVLIDEATANIDAKSDQLIQRVISKELRESTIITIAHRIDTIMSSDRIIVLDRGRIAEIDKPSQLLQKANSLFRKLYEQSQAIEKENHFQ